MIFSINDIVNIKTEQEFERIALEIFHFQAVHNSVYKSYIDNLRIKPDSVKNIQEIPFLPIEFYKYHKIVNTTNNPEIVFESSGTTGSETSKHYVTDVEVYNKSLLAGFQYFFGDISNTVFLALLPSYLERQGSSLVYMVQKLIEKSGQKEKGFYLYDYGELLRKIHILKKEKKRIILFGVTFALHELAEKLPTNLEDVIIIETGGMKGRREEITREELHNILSSKLKVKTIFSEYGMTELLSQAYSQGEGIFKTPPWMQIVIRDIYDPFTFLHQGKSGGINVIDLANINSCSFIETQDLGILHYNNSFEVTGRFDSSDIRGCNLMVG